MRRSPAPPHPLHAPVGVPWIRQHAQRPPASESDTGCVFCAKRGLTAPEGEGAGRAKYSRRNSTCTRAVCELQWCSLYLFVCVWPAGTEKNIHTRYEFRAGGQAARRAYAAPRRGGRPARRPHPAAAAVMLDTHSPQSTRLQPYVYRAASAPARPQRSHTPTTRV